MPIAVRELYWTARRAFGTRRLLVFARNLPADGDTVSLGSVVAEHVPPAELAGLAAVRGDDPSDYTARLAAGHRLIHIGDTRDPFAAWGWITLADATERETPWEGAARLAIPPGAAYFWDFFTKPSARGQRLYPRLLRDAMVFAAGHGISRVFIYCDAANIASAKGIVAAGFAAPAAVNLFRAGPLLVARGPRGRHISLGSGSVPIDTLLP